MPGILFNSDGGSGALFAFEPPITRGQLCRVVDSLQGTQVDVFIQCVSYGSFVVHGTRVGEVYGLDMADDEFENENFRRWAANVKGLLDSGEDPLAIWAGRTHELGMRFFAGLRMNDIHKDWVERWPSLRSRWERERPHVAIGRDVPPGYRSRNARPGQPSDGFTCAFDFAVDEVREHKLALVGELCAGYDIDGLEMDFLSHPIYFKAGREREGAPLLTDFMRRARALADKAAADKGAERPTGGPGESGESRDSLTSPGNRKLTLVARVPASVEACEASASTCAHLDRGGARRRGGAGDPGLPRHEPRHPRPRGDRGRRSLRDLRRAVGSVCAPLPGTQRPAGLRRDAAGRGAAALARRGIGHPPVQLRLPRHRHSAPQHRGGGRPRGGAAVQSAGVPGADRDRRQRPDRVPRQAVPRHPRYGAPHPGRGRGGRRFRWRWKRQAMRSRSG